jgi:prolyl-tRNA editing enzyme YbaK/EbsC (Cys-tRNA(Pro) deacylase)
VTDPAATGLPGGVVGRLAAVSALSRPDLLADRVVRAIQGLGAEFAADTWVAQIDPEHADTATLVALYGVSAAASGNCVLVGGRRGGHERVAACVVPATTRADVNGLVRRRLDVRKASFLPVERAVSASGMEYGGITAIGLPSDWPVLLDAALVELAAVVIGSGVRRSKLILPGRLLASLPQVEIVAGLGLPGTAPG